MANRVREIRKIKGTTLAEVAAKVGCSIPFLSDVELNRRGAKPETWQRIADAMGVTVEQLKGEDQFISDDQEGR